MANEEHADAPPERTHQVLGVVKPGDIVIVECWKDMNAYEMSQIKKMLGDDVNAFGVKFVVLPFGFTVSKVETL